MGMFDSVYARCKCGKWIEFQSKAGDCNLNDYEADEVPIRIAQDLDGETKTCDRCGNTVTLHYPKAAPTYVSMRVEQ